MDADTPDRSGAGFPADGARRRLSLGAWRTDILAHGLGFGRSGERLLPPRSTEGWMRTVGVEEVPSAITEEITRQYRETVGLFGLSAYD